MQIRTGYFAKISQYKKENYYPVNVSRFPPKWFKDGNAYIFAPSKKLFNFTGNDTEYEKLYREYLEKLPLNTWTNFKQFYNDLCLNNGFTGIVLCCYEKDPNDCHRNILGKVIEEKIKMKVTEFSDYTEKETDYDRI